MQVGFFIFVQIKKLVGPQLEVYGPVSSWASRARVVRSEILH